MKKLVKPTNPEAQVPDITGFSGYFLPNAWTLKDFGTYLMRRENKKEIESKSSIQLREEAEKAGLSPEEFFATFNPTQDHDELKQIADWLTETEESDKALLKRRKERAEEAELAQLEANETSSARASAVSKQFAKKTSAKPINPNFRNEPEE